MSSRRMLPLLDLDPDLGTLLGDDRREDARRQLSVEVYRIPRGPWDFGAGEDASPEHVGLLLLDGVVSREVLVADTVSTELLGPGDVVRPWTMQESPEFLELEVRWTALTESRIAVLDRRFGARLSAWPEVNAALIDRVNARAQRLATTQAISQLVRVDRRLLALFWHLAERWGRVTGDGVLVPLTLSHRMLSQLVGARRPTVSTAIGTLTDRGELVRRDDGTWLVKGEPVGLPAGGTGRAVPARRRFLKPAGEPEPMTVVAIDPEPEAVDEAPHLEPIRESTMANVLTARAELRETLERLRTESQERLDALKAVAEENERLLRTVAEGRARRQAARAGNGHTPPRPPRG